MERGNEIKVPVFNVEKMNRLNEEDILSRFIYEDLSKRNPNINPLEIMEIVFNTLVLEDPIMIEIYNNIEG